MAAVRLTWDEGLDPVQFALIATRLGSGPLMSHVIKELERRLGSQGGNLLECSVERERELRAQLAKHQPWAHRCMALHRRKEAQPGVQPAEQRLPHM